jgi:hypothetical protein
MCEFGYFCEYVLGWRSIAGIKAEKGTCTHKILEILSKIKFAQQNQENGTIIDELYGEIDIRQFSIKDISQKIADYYSQSKFNKWSTKDKEDCYKWVQKQIIFNNGMFNPLNLNIISPEQSFDFTIDAPWANYCYCFDNKKIDGKLAIKGTIDLITSPSPGILEVIDFKTGRKLDWATGEEKDYEKLLKDAQLMLYYYAASRLYPDVDEIIMTIDFINDGGPVTLGYTKANNRAILQLLQNKFELIKSVQRPKCSKSWKCTKFCYHGMNTFKGTGLPILTNKEGKPMTRCEQLNYEFERKNMEKIMLLYTNPEHQIGYYHNPGGI